MPYSIPLAGCAVSAVEGDGRFDLVFDDEVQSRLSLHGPFIIKTIGQQDLFEPPCAEWVRDILLSLAGVAVVTARYDRRSALKLAFADGRELIVDDGPFENWHYSNAAGVRFHGGAGRVS